MSRIFESIIEQLKQISLTSLINLSKIELKKVGTNWIGKCPFHTDKDRAFGSNT